MLNGQSSLILVLGGGFLDGLSMGGSEFIRESEGRPAGSRLEVSRVIRGFERGGEVDEDLCFGTVGRERMSPAIPRERAMSTWVEFVEFVSVIGMNSSRSSE